MLRRAVMVELSVKCEPIERNIFGVCDYVSSAWVLCSNQPMQITSISPSSIQVLRNNYLVSAANIQISAIKRYLGALLSVWISNSSGDVLPTWSHHRIEGVDCRKVVHKDYSVHSFARFRALTQTSLGWNLI